jgi:O-antigen ligase
MVNQERLRVYMADKHFGVGIGMSRGRAETYQPDAFVSKIPSDSWYVLIWVETGIVGLILHLLILLSVPAYGAYLILFKLRDPTVRGIVSAMVCGISGLYVSSYTIEIIGQFPTGFILYTCMAVVYMSPRLDKVQTDKNAILEENYG